MARRRLSDLMREEANKPSEGTTAAAEAEQSADEPDAETLDAVGEAATIDSSVPTKASTAAKNHSTKRTATEPQAIPEQQQDETLLQQITDQKATIEQLQTELEQMNALKTELEQTRNDVRQLSDANAKLTKELKTLQTKKPAADTSAPVVAKTRDPQELKLAPPPVEASGHPLNSFNRDVGWFD